MDRPPGPAVVLTREREDNRELASALREQGVVVREIPCVATRFVKPVRLPQGAVDAVAFTSRRGVRGMLRQDLTARLVPEAARPLVAAVGRATERELALAGIQADLVAEPPQGRVLAGLLARKLDAGARIAVVRGNLRTKEMDTVLEQAGFCLDPVVVYENPAPEIAALDPFPVAAVFVAAPSAARRLVEKNPWMKDESFCAIGPTTAAALRELGIHQVQQVGTQPRGWMQALVSAYRRSLESEEP